MLKQISGVLVFMTLSACGTEDFPDELDPSEFSVSRYTLPSPACTLHRNGQLECPDEPPPDVCAPAPEMTATITMKSFIKDLDGRTTGLHWGVWGEILDTCWAAAAATELAFRETKEDYPGRFTTVYQVGITCGNNDPSKSWKHHDNYPMVRKIQGYATAGTEPPSPPLFTGHVENRSVATSPIGDSVSWGHPPHASIPFFSACMHRSCEDIWHRVKLEWRCDCGVGSTNTNKPVLIRAQRKYSYFPSAWWHYVGPDTTNHSRSAHGTTEREIEYAQADFSALWDCFDKDYIPQPAPGGRLVNGTKGWQPWLTGTISPVIPAPAGPPG